MKIYNYFDDRSDAQKKEHRKIENIKKYKLNNEKKVIIIGLDGIELKIIDKINSLYDFKYDFSIQNNESVYGWISIIYGNIMRYEKSIFDIVENSINCKSSAVVVWKGFDQEVFKKNYKISEYMQFHTPNSGWTLIKKDEILNKKNYREILKKINMIFEKAKDNFLSKKYNLMFHYDVFFDESCHGGNDYNSKISLDILESYKVMLEYYFKNSDENTLIIITTDHGRNPDNFDHDIEFSSCHKSWIVSNKNLESIIDRKILNLYDIKTIIFNWLIN